MTLERTIANAFALDDAAWRRHANPWSVALRNTALPLLVLAFWSRLRLGWLAVVPVILTFFMDLAEPPHLPGTGVIRSPGIKSGIRGADLAQP